MTPQPTPQPDNTPQRVIFSRGDIIAVALALSLLAGLFIPLPRMIFDIFWACSLCLSAALLLIAFSAQKAADLGGFGPLMILAALARIALYAASARLIITSNTAGTLIHAIGSPLVWPSPRIIILLCPIIAVIVLIAVFKSARQISDTSFSCITEQIPLRKMDIETSLRTGIISPTDAANLQERCFQQAAFYLNSAATARILRCDAVISLVVVLAAVIASLTMSIEDGRVSESALASSASASTGAAILMLVPSVAIAAASSRLVKKSTEALTSGDSAPGWHPGEKIEIVSNQTGGTETVELLNPDFAQISQENRTQPASNESIAEFEPAPAVAASDEVEFEKAAADRESVYDTLADRLAALRAGQFPVIFTALGGASLPVTVPVNVAIRLAQSGIRTLLIDTDSVRNAIAGVFDLENASFGIKPLATCIENIFIQSVTKDTSTNEGWRKDVSKYGAVIVYAPDVDILETAPANLAGNARTAFVFTFGGDRGDSVPKVLGGCNCTFFDMPAS